MRLAEMGVEKVACYRFLWSLVEVCKHSRRRRRWHQSLRVLHHHNFLGCSVSTRSC